MNSIDESRSYMYFFGILIFIFIFVAMITLSFPNEYEGLMNRGKKLNFTLGIYHEIGMFEKPVQGYLIRESKDSFQLYLNGKEDDKLKIIFSSKKQIILESKYQTIMLSFCKDKRLQYIIQKIKPNKKYHIQEQEIIFPQ